MIPRCWHCGASDRCRHSWYDPRVELRLYLPGWRAK